MPGPLKVADFDPGRLFIVPLGVGNAFTRRRFHSSFLMLVEGRALLVDCPAPLRRILWESGGKAPLDIDIHDIDHLILTHLHGDHCNGVEEFLFYKRFVQDDETPTIYLLPELRHALWENRLKAAMNEIVMKGISTPLPQELDNYTHVRPWIPGETMRLDVAETGLEFEIRRTRHFIPCFGFRVRFGSRLFGYSGDTEFDEEHIEFLKDCDLIIHETGRGEGHTPFDSLLRLPIRLREKMLVIHYPDDFDVAHSPIPALLEGSIYELGAGRDPIKPESVGRK